MEAYQKIEAAINKTKDVNIEAGVKLHEQMHRAQNAKWSREELSEYLRRCDVADEFSVEGDTFHAEIRNIQDAIINFYSEDI